MTMKKCPHCGCVDFVAVAVQHWHIHFTMDTKNQREESEVVSNGEIVLHHYECLDCCARIPKKFIEGVKKRVNSR